MSGRILVVTNDFPPRTGGIESFVFAMTGRLPAGQVVVHTANQPGAALFDAVLPFPVVRDPASVLLPTATVAHRVARTARDYGCDRVWFGAAAPLGLLAPVLRRAGVRRTVATTHGHEVWWARVPVTRSLMHRIGEVNDVVTYLGQYSLSQIAPALSAPAAARMRRLTPGVDGAVFRPGSGGPRLRRALGLDDRPVLVCVSRFVPRKGQDVLVEALPAIRRQVPDASVLLVGDGPHRRRVERLVDRLGLRDDVRFAGQVPWPATPAYYDAGDVFCMPTRTRRGGLEPEGLGICYLEAAASGLPVIVGDSGGATDAVLDGRTGYVVDGRDVASVAERCAELLLDRARARRFGAAGRDWVSAAWNWPGQAGELRRLLAAGPDSDRLSFPAGGSAQDSSTSPATSQYWL
ncbi:MAG TPA: glycosyltransferase family 4 protein [Kineosporiaceae bacterium]|nr:glycosyltransferase family 4 protein [Kineosporiaceae bacterium]